MGEDGVEDMSLRGEEWRVYEAPRDSPSQTSDSGIIKCACVTCMAPEIREIRHWFFVDKMKMLRGIPISDAHAGRTVMKGSSSRTCNVDEEKRGKNDHLLVPVYLDHRAHYIVAASSLLRLCTSRERWIGKYRIYFESRAGASEHTRDCLCRKSRQSVPWMYAGTAAAATWR
jgi:hypothetical protein